MLDNAAHSLHLCGASAYVDSMGPYYIGTTRPQSGIPRPSKQCEGSLIHHKDPKMGLKTINPTFSLTEILNLFSILRLCSDHIDVATRGP